MRHACHALAVIELNELNTDYIELNVASSCIELNDLMFFVESVHPYFDIQQFVQLSSNNTRSATAHKLVQCHSHTSLYIIIFILPELSDFGTIYISTMSLDTLIV